MKWYITLSALFEKMAAQRGLTNALRHAMLGKQASKQAVALPLAALPTPKVQQIHNKGRSLL
ncbi:MAG: hypothetical protein FWC70_02890 [Defluviitaleaceae bacterium]|nr:hypothetical protein [Defluviitaleaceae bacterium]